MFQPASPESIQNTLSIEKITIVIEILKSLYLTIFKLIQLPLSNALLGFGLSWWHHDRGGGCSNSALNGTEVLLVFLSAYLERAFSFRAAGSSQSIAA
jgi:hypothetical protein